VGIAGFSDIQIGETISCLVNPVALPLIKIDEPTLSMNFSINDSPFAGTEGKFVTSRQLRKRLYLELEKNVSLRVEDTDSTDAFKVSGRGEMHLSILIENMRREGYEFAVGAPKVLIKEIDGVTCEPMERLVIDVPETSVGSVMEKMGTRKAELTTMAPMGSRMRLEFSIPSRGLFGYKNEFLTDTKGEGVMNSVFDGYQPFKGEIAGRLTGSLVAFETGEAVSYGIFNAQERGIMFVEPGMEVYEGMIVGVSPKAEDINVNVCKKKHVTNMRASGSDEALRLIPPKKMSLEEAIEFITSDEIIEVTPLSIRIRKKILDNNLRAKARNRNN
ncbi:MAG: translational GTPase TypA, partial [Clostridia bacterium]|nr:translational GTPase TypA [Clostridia bacterium]